jgi:hypothetical protein
VTNAQLYFSVGTPSFLVLVGILINLFTATALRTEMSALRSDLHGEMGSLRNLVHTDQVALHERMARLEERRG